MKWFRKAFHHIHGGAIGALLVVVVSGTLHFPQFSGGLTRRSYDILYSKRPTISVEDVVLIYMDEKSHEVLNQNYSSIWDRKIHAKLLNRLTDDGAKAVIMDIVFSDETDPESDKMLADAIRRHGNVVLACDWTEHEVEGNIERSIHPPNDMFFEELDDIGMDELVPDEDFVVRRHFVRNPDMEVSSVSWSAAKIAGAAVTHDTNSALEERWMNYYGPPDYLPNVSYYKAVIDNEEGLPPNYFRDKIVFVGSAIKSKMSGEKKDEYRNPYAFWLPEGKGFMPGVEIHATQFLNLYRGDWFSRVPLKTELNVIILTGLLLGFLLPQLRPMSTLVIGPLIAAIVAVFAYILFTKGNLWFNWLLIAAVQVPLASIYGIVFAAATDFLQSKLLGQSLAMYVSPAMVKEISKNPEMMKPGAAKQELSVLFSDIANFTTMSEGMDPDDLATLMNRYFEGAVNLCIQATNGTVVKFIGDAIFAIWNAPLPQENHRELACRGAILLRDQVTDFDFKKPGLDSLDVRTRIGLHCGEASVGNFGSTKRMDYTAFGENINLSSRMEGLNKYLGTSILATGDIINPVKDKFATRFLGNFILKGFNRDVEVFELINTIDQAEASRAYREPFAEALKYFRARDWDGAESLFKRILDLQPDDGPSKFYLKQLAELRESPPEPDWHGEIELKEK